MHLTKWKIKKDFFYLFIYVFFFFALNTPPMELAVDEVRSFRWAVGSGQDGWWALTTDWCHVSTILEGHNHDLIVLKLKRVNYCTDASRTIRHRDQRCFFFFYAYKTFYFLGYKLNSSQLPTNGPLPAWWMHTMLTLKKLIRMMICINYIKGFQTEMHVCKVLWINSLLELLTI